MRLTAAEKGEVIRLAEGSDLSVRQTLRDLQVPRATFYAWYRHDATDAASRGHSLGCVSKKRRRSVQLGLTTYTRTQSRSPRPEADREARPAPGRYPPVGSQSLLSSAAGRLPRGPLNDPLVADTAIMATPLSRT